MKWRGEVEECMAELGETWSDVEAFKEKKTRGAFAGEPSFFVWTAENVYFPTEYDGDWSVDSVPRNPGKEG